MDALGHHAEQDDVLTRQRPDEVEHPVVEEALKDVAGHVLGRGHVLERCVGEALADELGVRDLEQDLVRQAGIDLERVPEAHLFCRQTGR